MMSTRSFISAMVALSLCAGPVVADEEPFLVRRDSPLVTTAPTFPVLGKPIDPNGAHGHEFFLALQKYPRLESCLEKQDGTKYLDVSKFSWSRFQSPEEVRLCVFFVAHALANPNHVVRWAEAQEFRVERFHNRPGYPVIVPGDNGNREDNQILRAFYRQFSPRPERSLGRMLWEMWFPSQREPWRFAEQRYGFRILYASPQMIVEVETLGGGVDF